MATAQPSTLATARTSTLQSLRETFADTVVAYLFLLPFLIIYIMFRIYPLFRGIYISLHEWELVGTHRKYIGLENYEYMLWKNLTWDIPHQLIWRILGLAVSVTLLWWLFRREKIGRIAAIILLVIAVAVFAGILGLHPEEGARRWGDELFRTAVKNTLYFVALSTPVIVIVGLLLAVALNRPWPIMGLFRTVFFSSYIFSVSVVTLIWVMVLSPRQGILAHFMEIFGAEPISWLTDKDLAMPAIVITTLWWTVGFNMILFLAGLQDIPAEVYESAKLDGAGPVVTFFRMTLPLLKRTTIAVVVLQVMFSFQIFGQVYLMTRGGPAGATRVLVLEIYQTGFRDWMLGYASAMSMVLFVFMLGTSIVQIWLTQGEEA
jgi:multiple sugar transport system permease protein